MYDLMIKSQNQKPKLFFIFLTLFVSISFSVFCESSKQNLILADSLFKQKKYTQSFELYENILYSDKKTSSAMLLKMAFIKEGLGDFTNALYYLDLYYLKTNDKKVLKKMENLAEQKNLSGYEYDDIAFFLNMYYQYQLQIDLLIIGLILMVFAIIFYQKKKNKMISRSPGVAYIFLLIILLVVNNFGREHKKAIITSPLAYLMKGPSPGSELIEVATQGHRVEILGQEDIWSKITWNDQTAYIKNTNLKQVKL